jgi:hypothetical protein
MGSGCGSSATGDSIFSCRCGTIRAFTIHHSVCLRRIGPYQEESGQGQRPRLWVT